MTRSVVAVEVVVLSVNDRENEISEKLYGHEYVTLVVSH